MRRYFFCVKNGGYSLPEELELYEGKIREVLGRPHLQAQAAATGFVQRSSKVSADDFFDALLYVASLHDHCSLSSMVAYFEDRYGIDVRKQSLDERFNVACLEFVKLVLMTIISDKILSICEPYQGKLGDRYTHIRSKDSTKFKVPDALEAHYKGNGGSLAGISIQYEYDFLTGQVFDLAVYSGDRNDRSDAVATKSNVEVGDLIIRDLGYHSLDVFQFIADKGAFFLSRHYTPTSVFCKNGERVSFKELHEIMKKTGMQQMEIEVYLGNEHRIPVRMLLIPVSEEVYKKRVRDRKKEQKKRGGAMTEEMCACYRYSIFITNADSDILPTDAILLMYKLRWQIELHFKAWKSLFCIHKIEKMKEERFLCLLFARLILIIINLQLTYRVQNSIQTTRKDGKRQRLSFYKALHTLTRHFDLLYTIFRGEKRMARVALISLLKMLSNNHFLESKKNKIGLNEIIELLC
ncbi:IS4 family transposase [Bacteroidia bacterium]|nr:IS4 family transposase [Bacteroidia bacterium]